MAWEHIDDKIMLVGHSGAGKTTLAKKLEKDGGFKRITIDELIDWKNHDLSLDENDMKDTKKRHANYLHNERELIMNCMSIYKHKKERVVIDCPGSTAHSMGGLLFQDDWTVVHVVTEYEDAKKICKESNIIAYPDHLLVYNDPEERIIKLLQQRYSTYTFTKDKFWREDE